MVAMLKTTSATVNKHVLFLIKFSRKNHEKKRENMRKSTDATKIDSKSSVEPLFLATNRFSIDFGIPGGTPKCLKIGDPFWVKGSWRASGCLSWFRKACQRLLLPSGWSFCRFWVEKRVPRETRSRFKPYKPTTQPPSVPTIRQSLHPTIQSMGRRAREAFTIIIII